MADQWIASKVNLKPSTRALYDSILETHVRPRWATTQLARVTHEDIQVWVSALLAAGTGAAHVRKIVGTVLRGILALAVRSKRLPANPCDGIQLPRISHTAKRYLTAARVAALADAAAELPARRPRRGTDASFAQYRLATLTLAYCGLRWSELAALRTSRVDLLRRRILVAEAVVEVDGKQLVWGSPKNHEVRSIPVPRFLADELATHLMHKAPTDLVFTSPTGGVLRNRNARKAWFDRAAVAIGELGLTPHELRHTAASLAVSAGANVKAVQRILGHASATLTLDTYADLSDSDLDAVADRLDAAFRANSEPATASIRHLPPAGDLG
ncbi:MAG TPA: tyrosine-type recombinase/integrase [Mycobacteriales bacterium]|nr:tyrosine-type recombinase/integrase [Mycobacteriales bacterium]